MTLAEIRAAIETKKVQLRAKLAEIDAATGDRVQVIYREHEALIAEYDGLVDQEARAACAEARDAHVATFPKSETKTMTTRPYGSSASASGVERGRRNLAIEAVLLARHDEQRFPLPATALEFRGMTLLELAREVLEAEGTYRRGDGRNDVAIRSLQATSDFPNILANVANKTLLGAYAVAAPTFKPLGRKMTLPDFKPASLIRLSDAPQLLEVLENGEFKRGSMSDSANSIKLKTYGRIVSITRQVILNDDVGAFTTLPEAFGTQAANLESDLVWSMILSNPVLGDGNPVFSAAHGNVVTSGGAAPSVVSVGDGRARMAKQTNASGSVLNVRPRFLVVPSELEVGVQQLLFTITPNSTAAAVPQSVSSLVPISEPRLSTGVRGQAGSNVAWYLVPVLGSGADRHLPLRLP